MPSTRFFLRCTAVLSLLCSNVALAGPVERMAEVAVHPTKPDVMVLSYVNGGTGLLYTTDGGHEFRLLCSSAIASSKPKGPIAVTNDGPLLLGEFDTLWQDDGKGCGWSGVSQVSGKWLTDFAVHPADSSLLFSVSANGGTGVKNGLIRRDAADKWVDVGSRDELGISRVRVVKTGSGMRFYESALKVPEVIADAGAGQPTYWIRVSDDEGQTWREHQVMIEGIGSLRLEAVDPNNPDRIVASIARENKPDDLLLSSDQGAHFEPYLEVSDLGAIALAPDGRVWIGEPSSISNPSASKGLWFAASLDAKPSKVADFGVECLVYQPQSKTLLACQAAAFGKVDTTSWEFTQYSHFNAIKNFVSCSDKEIAKVCEAQMCLDYCGPMHYAQAPLCCAYNTETCGPLVAKMEGTGGPEMCMPAADGGMPAAGASGSEAGKAGGAAGSGGSTAGSGGSKAGSGGSTGNAAGEMSPPTGSDSDGCGCRALGASTPSPARAYAVCLSLLSLVALRRRRRKSRSVQSQNRLDA